MITYKPSARLGLLNEENFTSDPTARGWTVTNNGGSSYSYGGNGFTITSGLSTSTNIDLINTTKFNCKQYFMCVFSCPSSQMFRNTEPTLKIYANNVLVGTFDLGYNNNNVYNGFLVFHIFKNTKNDWKFSCLAHDSFSSHTFTLNTIDIGSDTITNIKFNFTGATGSSGVTNNYLYFTNLKWV